jgi:hypothetical protein
VLHLLAAAVPGASVSYGLAELQPDETLFEAVGRADAEMYARRRALRQVEQSPGSEGGRST